MRTIQRSHLGVLVFSAIAGGILIGLPGRQLAARAAPVLADNCIYLRSSGVSRRWRNLR